MKELGSSEVLKFKIRLGEPRLNAASQAFWDHPRFLELLPEYLFRLHCAMRASVPLMETARRRAMELASECPVAARLVPYYTRHIREETGHDEWLLEDLALLGRPPHEVLGQLPSPDVAQLIGTLYYWTLHVHPVAVLAYLAVTEGSPVAPAVIERIAARGVQREALRTLHKHAVLDVRHGEEVFRTIDRLPLTAAHQELLGVASLVVIGHLSLIIEQLLQQHGTGRRRSRRTTG